MRREEKIMGIKNIFKRYEIKYLLNKKDKEDLLKLMKDKMILDEHGQATIRNIYYDTNTYLLARRSLEKPTYKEKLRVRSYVKSEREDLVFVELKKKCKSEVFKRRIRISQGEAISFLGDLNMTEKDLNFTKKNGSDEQIAKEIMYFRNMYRDLKPVVFLSYEREAYFAKDDEEVRITFDNNIRYRTYNLDLSYEPSGEFLIDEGITLMEVKTGTGMPMWLAHFLSDKHIYKASFSKYGAAYKDLLRKGEINV